VLYLRSPRCKRTQSAQSLRGSYQLFDLPPNVLRPQASVINASMRKVDLSALSHLMFLSFQESSRRQIILSHLEQDRRGLSRAGLGYRWPQAFASRNETVVLVIHNKRSFL
jgi:hypothetical protein